MITLSLWEILSTWSPGPLQHTNTGSPSLRPYISPTWVALDIFSYFISYFNDTIDRLAYIQQKVFNSTHNKNISVASLLTDETLPCSYLKQFSKRKTCKPTRRLSYLNWPAQPDFQLVWTGPQTMDPLSVTIGWPFPSQKPLKSSFEVFHKLESQKSRYFSAATYGHVK